MNIILEQLVVGGDDVLYFGAILGLLQTEGVDQDALVRNGARQALEFSQAPAAGRQLFQDDSVSNLAGSSDSRGFTATTKGDV